MTRRPGKPDPGVVVRLPEPMATFERQVAQAVEEQAVLVGHGRREVPGLPHHVPSFGTPHGELGVEGPGQVARGFGVPLEPFGHVDVSHDVRWLVSPFDGILEKRRRAESMVVVPVGVDHITDGKVGEGPQLVDHAGAIGEEPGVDDSHPLGADDDGRVAEAGQKVHAGSDLPALGGRS